MESLKVLFASPEVVPFVKTGGLADVSGMLPKKLAAMGHTVKVALPDYATISQKESEAAREDIAFDIPDDGVSRQIRVRRMDGQSPQLEYLFLGCNHCFDRRSLYVDPETGLDYPDNHGRFSFFCRGLLETIKKLDWMPDIIHANDWQTALLPTYLATVYKNDPFFAKTRTVYTIHNLAYQGVFPPESFSSLGLPVELFRPLGPLEFWGKVNFMKSAVVLATVISTVSERYAAEIQSSDEYGYGLEGVLRARNQDLFGIINGVDYSVWSPSRDKLIPSKFSPSNLSGKKKDKVELVNRLGLPVREQTPLIGMITRLADQKGLDLIAAAADDLFQLDLQMIVLGTGDKKYHELLMRLEKTYPDKLKVLLTFDDQMAHWIEAGADMFLMPSRYEPCGLNQLYSLKYGTLPIVRATGGLADTVENINPQTGTGTGFVFERYDPEDMLDAIRRGISLFSRKRIWGKIMKAAMSRDYSWDASAKKYVELYTKALAKA
jgi:starch synthase